MADIGAGTGFMAAGLAPLVNKVYVIDGSPAMLEVARKNLGQLANLEYHLADGASIPLPDESLEAGLCQYVPAPLPRSIGGVARDDAPAQTGWAAGDHRYGHASLHLAERRDGG